MLYLVPTPIGNLGDITLRALEVLKNVDCILCEDTRTSSVLLNHFEIKKELKSYHKFNETQVLESVIKRLEKGDNIALISDAGTPAISDPGEILVKEVIKRGLEYTVLPGANAAVTAFVMSGFEYPFTFVGFLPDKKGDRRKILQSFAHVPSCLIFYISPHKICDVITDLADVLGNRRACSVREISKKFEETYFFNLKEEYNGTIKGEFVLIVDKSSNENSLNELTIEEHLKHYMELGLVKNDAMKSVARDRGVSKSEIYNYLIKK